MRVGRFAVERVGEEVLAVRRECRSVKGMSVGLRHFRRLAAIERERIHLLVIKFNNDIFRQMSGILFIKELYSLPAKVIKKIQNEISKGSILLKAAYIDGDVFIGDNNLNMLSKLKTKNELIAEMVSSLKDCYTNITLSLNSPINNIYGIFETLKKNIN